MPSRPRPRSPEWRPFRLALLLLACAGGLTGCVGAKPSPPPPARAPWQTQTGQAVWQPRRDAPPLAGELVLARRPGGEFFLQFSKPPLTLVEASRAGPRWRIAFPGFGREYRGRGAGTTRLLWLWLSVALEGGPLPSALTFHREADRWRLVHARTGESLEGWLSP
jgi:hypothetical protein